MNNFPTYGILRIIIPCSVAAGAALILDNNYILTLLFTFFLYLAMAQMWNLLAGYGGVYSLGHQSFLGIGGYAAALIAQQSIGAAIGVGAVFSGVLACIISLLLVRTRGIFYSVGTWLIAEMLALAVLNTPQVGSGTGLFIKGMNEARFGWIFIAALVTAQVSVVIVGYLLSSGIGFGLIAGRENESAAASLGVNINRIRATCFILSALITGLAGGLLYLHLGFIQPYRAFSIDWTVKLLFMTILGGIGSIEGPAIGALLLVFIEQALPDYTEINLLLSGICIIVCALVFPDGIAHFLLRKSMFGEKRRG